MTGVEVGTWLNRYLILGSTDPCGRIDIMHHPGSHGSLLVHVRSIQSVYSRSWFTMLSHLLSHFLTKPRIYLNNFHITKHTTWGTLRGIAPSAMFPSTLVGSGDVMSTRMLLGALLVVGMATTWITRATRLMNAGRVEVVWCSSHLDRKGTSFLRLMMERRKKMPPTEVMVMMMPMTPIG